MEKRTRLVCTPEQKFAMLKDIETVPTVKEGLEKHQLCHSVYQKWKRQIGGGRVIAGHRESWLWLQPQRKLMGVCLI